MSESSRLHDSLDNSMETEMILCDQIARKHDDPAPERRKLEDLPSELLAIIALHLLNSELRLLREVGSWRINECIDRIFVSRSTFN